MKKVVTLIVVLLIGFALFATGQQEFGDATAVQIQKGDKIGVSLTSKAFQRWVMDGDNLSKILKENGYVVDLQYGNNQPQTQISQLENMITTGCKALVIAPIDNGALAGVLARAKEQGILIINYDLLILNTPDIDYFVGFDNTKVGGIQARFIEEKLGLKEGKGPFNIELFAGSLDENNSYFYYDGAMEVFKPYLENGQLVVPSGQTEIERITIPGWVAETAQARMDNLVTAYYSTGRPLHAVHVPADSLAVPVVTALKNVGYGSADKPFPVVTGNDATIAAVKSIIAGDMSMSVYKDTRLLAQKVVSILNTLATGGTPVPDDTKTFDNGVKVIPAMIATMEALDITNYKKLVLDTGYYTKAQLGL